MVFDKVSKGNHWKKKNLIFCDKKKKKNPKKKKNLKIKIKNLKFF